MANKCVLCDEKIEEENGKLKGTIVKAIDENKKNQFIMFVLNVKRKMIGLMKRR